MRTIITATAFAFALSTGFAATAAEKAPTPTVKSGQVAEGNGQAGAKPKQICETRQYVKYVNRNAYSNGYQSPQRVVLTITHCEDQNQ